MKIASRWLRGAQGFTLVELLVVILIIGILLAVAAPSFLGQVKKANDSAAEQYLAIAYREAAAATTSYDGNFGGTLDGPTSRQAIADAINHGEAGLLTAAPGSCPDDATSDPRNIVVSEAANGDLVLCNAVQDGSQHTVWTLTVVDHVLQPLSSSEQTGTGIGAPRVTTDPSLSSSGQLSHVQVGDHLHVADGSWVNDPTGFSYQWQRSTDGSTWVDATGSGATTSDYIVDSTDLGDYLRATVTGSNTGGDRAVSTPAVGPVLPADPMNDPAHPPTIADSDQLGGATTHVQVGDQLTSSTGQWSNSPTGFSYQWQRSTDGSDWLGGDIPGATAATYTVTAADLGDELRLIVQASNAGGTGSASSNATSAVFPATPSNDPADPPSYSGLVQVGQDLTASTGTWAPTPDSYSYQWQHSTNGGQTWTNATGAGATSSVYTVDSSDYGDVIQVCVTAHNTGGDGAACSGVPAGASAASPAAPVNTAAPAVTGLAQVDQTLHTSDGTWSSQDPSLTYTYQWQSSPDGSAWTDIAGATASDYTVVLADVGDKLRAIVTAHDSYGGSSSASSDPTAAVVASAPVGTVVAYAGASVPSGWLLANGQAVSRSAYSDLYAVEGTSYGSGDGSTTFNLPDLQGRLPLGQSTSGTGSTLGESGGSLSMGGGTVNLPTISSLSFSTPTKTFTAGALSGFTPSGFSWPAEVMHYNYWGGEAELYGVSVGAGGALSSGWTSFNMPSQAATSGSVTPTASIASATPAYRVLRYLVKADPSAGLPACAVWASARASAPSGAVTANGQAASGSLSSCLDSSFGGSLPDLRGRFPLGQALSGTGSTLNGAGGSLDLTQTVTRTVPAVTVSVPNYTAPALTVPATSFPVTYSWWSYGEGNGQDQWTIVCPSGGAGGSNDSYVPAYPSPNNDCMPSTATASATSTSTASGGGGSYPSDVKTTSATTSAVNPAYLALRFESYTGASYSLATGTITAFVGSSAPAGWLKADGSCVSQSAYAALYAAVGSSYGSCSAGQFKLPDLTGRFPLGQAASGTGASVGETGGQLDITPQASLPAFTPTFTWSPSSFSFSVPNRVASLTLTNSQDHEYNFTAGGGGQYGFSTSGAGATFNSSPGGATTVTASASSQSVSGTATGATTATFPAENPAYQVFTYIIKT